MARIGGRSTGKVKQLAQMLDETGQDLLRTRALLRTAVSWLVLLSNRYLAVEQARRYVSETSQEMESLSDFLARVREGKEMEE